MKNLKKFCITTIASFGILSTSVLAATGTVNAPSGLVLRGEASKVSTPLATVPDKTEVSIIEESGDWCKVKYNNQEGYLFKEFVDINKTEKPEEPENNPNGADNEQPESNTVTAKGKLKVYMMPVISSTVINEVDASAEIKIEKEITNWSYITAGNVQGWVRTYGIKGGTKQTVEPEKPEEKPTTQEPEPEKPEEPATPTVTEPEKPEVSEPADNRNSGETAVDNVKGFVTVDYANVRKEASTSSAIVTTLTKDTSFTITAETEEWYKITYTGLDGTVYVGYIYKNLAKK